MIRMLWLVVAFFCGMSCEFCAMESKRDLLQMPASRQLLLDFQKRLQAQQETETENRHKVSELMDDKGYEAEESGEESDEEDQPKDSFHNGILPPAESEKYWDEKLAGAAKKPSYSHKNQKK